MPEMHPDGRLIGEWQAEIVTLESEIHRLRATLAQANNRLVGLGGTAEEHGGSADTYWT
jgi:hypothetical protein